MHGCGLWLYSGAGPRGSESGVAIIGAGPRGSEFGVYLLGEVEEDEERGSKAEHEDHQVRVLCRGGERGRGEGQAGARREGEGQVSCGAG